MGKEPRRPSSVRPAEEPKKAVASFETNETELGFQAQVYNAVEDLPNRVRFPRDENNTGRMAALLMLWKRVADISEKKYDALVKMMVQDDIMTDPKSITTPGDHFLGGSNVMAINVNVSQPRREFNIDWFANELLAKYKVPIAVTKTIFEQAKQPGKTQTRKITVAEKGVNI